MCVGKRLRFTACVNSTLCSARQAAVGTSEITACIHSKRKKKEKERKSIYIAPFCTKVHSKRSGVDHTVLPANNTTPAFPSWRSPDVATTATAAADIQLQLTTHLSTPKG